MQLPYRFVIPDVLYADELINLRHYQREQLLDIGFVLGTLDGVQVGKASAYSQQHPQLSLNDCFALVMAETTEDAVLLTGDQRLYRFPMVIPRFQASGRCWKYPLGAAFRP